MRAVKIKALERQNSKLELETRTKETESRGRLRFSALNRAKSERNFLKNFRRKSSILARLLKEKAKEQRNLQLKIETLERFEGIKTKNDFFSIKCGIKKEFSSCRKLLEKIPTFTNITAPIKRPPKSFSVPLKKPVPLSSISFDPSIVPDCNKKPVSTEDLEFYLHSKKHSLARFN